VATDFDAVPGNLVDIEIPATVYERVGDSVELRR
jgi:hypothetical protein